MRPLRTLLLLLLAPLALVAQQRVAAPATPPVGFALADLMGTPFPANLVTSGVGERIAWTLNERGRRNIYVAEGPAFALRRLTDYRDDDGQELTAVTFSADGKWIAFVRGGDFSSNFDDALPVNPVGSANPNPVELWLVPFSGGNPVSLGPGLNPVFSPKSDAIVFERDRQLWRSPLSLTPEPVRLMNLRGTNAGARFSPDGSRIAFVSSRGDHAFIGIYKDASTRIQWLSPSTSRDWSPRWSPDGRRIAFARRPGVGGPPATTLEPQPAPWSIWIHDVENGTGTQRWSSANTLRGSIPTTDGGVNLHWTADDRLVFLSYQDGWPHLYSMTTLGTDSPKLLSTGDHMAEHISISRDGLSLYYSGNLGPAPEDIDRRHVVKVSAERSGAEVLTPGTGLEWAPTTLASGRVVAFGATAQRSPRPFIIDAGTRRWIDEPPVVNRVAPEQLVVPRQVVFISQDGVRVHGSLFEPPPGTPGTGRRPAIVYVHGGPPRQMLLGFHYGDYYFNAYLMNQYLASRGFIVLAVNYRLGIGYGHDFHRPPKAGAAGASEYTDVKSAGLWLQGLANVDPARIGIYGGSYGGYLTALALGRDSQLFAAGVDIHGVHDFTSDGGSRLGMNTWRFERSDADLRRMAETAWSSSPVSSVSTWKSPVLLIHGDDDRNVRFNQTTDLVQRLRAQGVEYEEIVIPDDTHHFMRHENQKRVNAAIAEYFERKLKPRQ